MNDITKADISKFIADYKAGKFPHQRMGQAFINHFKLDCDHSANSQPCLFHERNEGVVIGRLWSWPN